MQYILLTCQNRHEWKHEAFISHVDYGIYFIVAALVNQLISFCIPEGLIIRRIMFKGTEGLIIRRIMFKGKRCIYPDFRQYLIRRLKKKKKKKFQAT